MPKINFFHEVSREVADTLFQYRKDAEKANPIPFGMQEVDNRTWRRRWDSAPPEMRRQMAETLGPDTRTRLQELAKRVKPSQPDVVPFGGE